MKDIEISHKLALVIGYKPKQIRIGRSNVLVWNKQTAPGLAFIGWHKFDYRDPAVIWPIAERFDAFPARIEDEWDVYIPDTDEYTRSDTAAKAVALAVIKAHEGAKE